MYHRAMDGGETNSKAMMVNFMTLFGKSFDFNLGNRKKCTIQDWQNGHKITKSYDQYFGKLYDSNSDGYNKVVLRVIPLLLWQKFEHLDDFLLLVSKNKKRANYGSF